MKLILLAGALVVLFFVPLFFVLNKVYQDGVVGRIALLGVSFGAAGLLLQIWASPPREYSGAGVFLVCMFAVFICWHLWRFHRRVLRRERDPEKTWPRFVPE